MKIIVLTGGGTAGHVLGGVALLPKLETAFDKIYYIGSENGIEKEIIAKYPSVTYIGIKTTKLVRKLTFKNFAVPFKLLKSIKETKKILEEIKPNVIFSKGGFVSVPVVFAGHKLKIPIVCHESDLSLGLANRIAKNRATFVCTTFPETSLKLKNGVWSGSPIRKEIFCGDKHYLKDFGVPHGKPVLLVLGGSLGSQTLNNAIWQNLDFLCDHFFVVHITGRDKAKNIKHKNYAQLEYAEKMEDILAISNFAITRGGSNAIWELLELKIPMLIIPLSKKISRGDQIENAKYFEKAGYCLTLFEEDLTSLSLKDKTKELLVKKDLILQKMNELPPRDALDIIFKHILKCVK